MNHFQTRQRDWDNRLKSGFNPYHGCSQHKDCHDVDMNMVSSKVELGKEQRVFTLYKNKLIDGS